MRRELTVAGYLGEWLRDKQDTLRPATFVRYRDHVRNDLVPGFGRMRLADLRPRHVTAWREAQAARGRGRVAVYRIAATLSSALGSAVRSRLIPDNPCRYALPPRLPSPERICWNPSQAAAFLRHNHAHHHDQMADLFEVLIGTGLRRGEALGLHWPDVHLTVQTLLVRWSLTAVNNNRLYLGHPMTRASRNWVSLSPRVVAALQRQAVLARAGQAPGTALAGLVSATRTALRCVRKASWSNCAGGPPGAACRGSGCTTCGTPPPPSCSARKCRSRWSPRRCATRPFPPPSASTATCSHTPPATPSPHSNSPWNRTTTHTAPAVREYQGGGRPEMPGAPRPRRNLPRPR